MRENQTKNVFHNGRNVAICCIAMITGESRREWKMIFAEHTQTNSESVFLLSVASLMLSDKYRLERKFNRDFVFDIGEIFFLLKISFCGEKPRKSLLWIYFEQCGISSQWFMELVSIDNRFVKWISWCFFLSNYEVIKKKPEALLT